MITALVCTDGSDLSRQAIDQAMALLRPPDRVVVLTVIPIADPTLVMGTGVAGGVMSPTDKQAMLDREQEEAQRVVDEEATRLGLEEGVVETMVAHGDPGREICRMVDFLPADVAIIGTHGRGGIKRAVMGSTSDHVVRHASCPVVVQGRVG